ncbi:hypothetical protein PIB30_051597 [Stylosanthes scabra]|uniref:RNase H type-1 domain-containing protein n=1 Tax=Stylosanthes scabra TaxID=79078 RepID=A0ABU6XFP1_9FABA|nr:hypothetical protein [Stylosanthes scabra]
MATREGELFAIWRGLMLASELDYKDVLCETDCHEAFILINDSVLSSFNEMSCLIRRIKDLLQRQWRVQIVLIQRTANRVADALAKFAICNGIHHADWLQPWDDLKVLLQHDIH